MLYVALEPWVRRWWPHAMIGWARVVAGRWRDPLVARDILVAVATVVALGCVTGAAQLGSILVGGRLPEDVAPSLASQRPGFVLANLAPKGTGCATGWLPSPPARRCRT